MTNLPRPARKSSRGASPSSPAPRAASAAPSRWSWRAAAPMSSPWPAPRARWKRSMTKSARLAARPRSFPATSPISRARPARRRDLRALGQARYFRRQRRLARAVDARFPLRSRQVGQAVRGQRHRQLPPAALARPAAARLRRRPRRADLVGRGATGGLPRLLGPYATSKAAVDAMLRSYAADTVNVSNIKAMSVNPGPMRTKMRGVGDAGRRPDDPAHARGIRAETRRPVRAGLDADRQDLRFPHRHGALVPGTGLTAIALFALHKRARSGGEKAGSPGGKPCPAGCAA